LIETVTHMRGMLTQGGELSGAHIAALHVLLDCGKSPGIEFAVQVSS
jgi:hypothetical protein